MKLSRGALSAAGAPAANLWCANFCRFSTGDGSLVLRLVGGEDGYRHAPFDGDRVLCC